MNRAAWKSRFGFYLVAVGSAFGLGNLWRFPYIVAENGGGAFVLLYVLLALILGLPLLIAELFLGHSNRKSVMSATLLLDAKTHTRWKKWIGRLSVVISLVVLSYYSVISGWVLHFLMQFFIETASRFGVESQITMAPLMRSGVLQLGLASVHLLIATVIVTKGVQEGLEKWVGALMPAFVLMMVVLVTKTFSLPSTPEALRFLFYPDFSKLKLSSLLAAIGHVCFTLSLGFGTMVTFGSYLSDKEHIPTAAFRITLIDTLLSLVAGILIFPIALSFNHQTLKEPALLFEALPGFLLSLPGGAWFGILFFLCLYLASLSASISLLEVIVSNAMEFKKIPRMSAAWGALAIVLILATIPAFSTNLMRFTGEGSAVELLDFILIQLILPIAAVSIGSLVYTSIAESEKQRLFIDRLKIESLAMYSHWKWTLKYLVPAILFAAVLLQFFALLK